MTDVTTSEGSDQKLKFTLTYSDDWTEEAKQGMPVQASETAAVYFALKETQAKSEPLILLSDADDDEILWLDEELGEILVHLGANTMGYGGKKLYYELRVKLADGTYFTPEDGSGILTVEESIVGRPV